MRVPQGSGGGPWEVRGSSWRAERVNKPLCERGGEAALFVDENDVEGMVSALQRVQRAAVRDRLGAAGVEQAKRFSWARTAAAIRGVLEGAAAR